MYGPDRLAAESTTGLTRLLCRHRSDNERFIADREASFLALG